MKPHSIRLPEDQKEFVTYQGFSFPERVREWIANEQRRYLSGVCAACGGYVYVSDGHTYVTAGTPLANMFTETDGQDFDLCKECAPEAYNAMKQPDTQPLALKHAQACSWDVYAAERKACEEMQPASSWAPLFAPSSDTDCIEIVSYCIRWAIDTDRPQQAAQLYTSLSEEERQRVETTVDISRINFSR